VYLVLAGVKVRQVLIVNAVLLAFIKTAAFDPAMHAMVWGEILHQYKLGTHVTSLATALVFLKYTSNCSRFIHSRLQTVGSQNSIFKIPSSKWI
jgi:hypothetical protein